MDEQNRPQRDDFEDDYPLEDDAPREDEPYTDDPHGDAPRLDDVDELVDDSADPDDYAVADVTDEDEPLATAEEFALADDEVDDATAFDADVFDDVDDVQPDNADTDEDYATTAPPDEFGLDVDAALASVASLSDVIAQREAEEVAERQRQQAEARRWASYRFDHPPLATLRRGQITSFVPALLLMAFGAWLTFASTTGETLDGGLVALVAVGGVGVALLLFWLQSGRWARGALFVALALAGAAAAMVYLTQFDGPGVDGWPLLIAVPGAAAFLSAILARPADSRLALAGLALTAGALLMLALTAGLVADSLAADVDRIATEYGWIVLLAALVLLLIPLLLRRRA